MDKRGVPVTINGAMGEGGGQILRTSLALSLCSGKAFRIINLRSRRKKPGFRHQPLVNTIFTSVWSGKNLDGVKNVSISRKNRLTWGRATLLPLRLKANTSQRYLPVLVRERSERKPWQTRPLKQLSAIWMPVYLFADHLADQLLLPFALAGGGSYNSLKPTPHTRTNSEVLKLFMDIGISMDRISKDIWQITLSQAYQ